MKKHNIILMLLALTFVIAMPDVSAQKKSGEFAKEKQARSAQLEAHRTAIKAINNDGSLSETEKEELIKAKNAELRESIGKKARGQKGRKGKFESKEAREEWKKNRDAITKEIEAIENDENLTAEEKELKKRELLNEKLGEKRRKGKKKGAYRHLDEDERSALKAEKRAKFEAIKNDPNLTEEEKAAKIRELKNKNGKAGVVKGRKGDMDKGKGPHKEMTKKEWKEKHGNKGKDIAKQELTEEQKGKALDAIKRSEERLAKDLKKGKITQERYDSRMAKIQQVKDKVLR